MRFRHARAITSARGATGVAAALALVIAAPVAGQDDSPAQVADGYTMTLMAEDLNFPTAVATDGEQVWVSEAGIPPSPEPPRILAISEGGPQPVVSAPDLDEGQLAPPIIDLTFKDGWLYVSHRQMVDSGWLVGAISRFEPSDPTGTFETLVSGLPNAGDHHTNEIVFGDDGRMYFGIGTATNSAVVGLDNLQITGWLERFPDFHDFPAQQISLNGETFETEDPLDDGSDTAVTAPFRPFGSGEIDAGEVIEAPSPSAPIDGIIAGNGTVYSVDPSADDPASTLRLEAWGLRNPFGIGFDPADPSRLLITNNGSDVRGVGGEANVPIKTDPIGSRPISEDLDDLFEAVVGDDDPEFLGWPDFFHDDAGAVLPVTDPRFCETTVADIVCPGFILSEETHQRLETREALAQFADHSSANKFAYGDGEAFPDLYVALTGSFVPTTGAVEFSGYKVVAVDPTTYEVSDFIVNPGQTPEELFDAASFNKPIDVKFQDDRMLIVDFGVFEPGLEMMEPGTGKVWMVAASSD